MKRGNNSMNIAIRGTGSFGRYVGRNINENPNYTLKYYIDINKALCGTYVDDVIVISQEEFESQYYKEVDVILVAFMNSIDQFKQIVKFSKSKFGFIRNRVFEAKMELSSDLLHDRNIVWSDAPYLNKPILRSLETNIVDDCNLNCRGCSHFSNLFERGAQVPYETFCKDLKQVADYVYIHQFNMLGGEAILNDRIVEYIEYTRTLLPDSEIELISNGILIPRQSEEFFECCKENDITISISGYKPTLKMKNVIEDTLKPHQIIYIFREDVNEFGKNIDLSGRADKWEAVRKCRENKCHFLRNGKIYKCPFEALGNVFFEYFGLDIRFNGGTNIYDEQLDWEHLVDKLYHEPIEYCRFCGNEEKIEWRVANNPVIEDWII